jgi:uncharacterized protein (DUF2147 family)
MRNGIIAALVGATLTWGVAYAANDTDKPAASPASPSKPAAPGTSPTKAAAPSTAHSKDNKTAAAPINQFKTAAGFWQQADDDGFVGGWFYFLERNGLYEGRLVKMFKKPGAEEFSDKCLKCVGDQKEAPMLGLTIIKGMKRDGRKYDEGSILDPRDGTVYHAQLELSADGKELSVRGYLGIPLLGQTQIWKRLSDDAIPAADIPKESLSPSAAQ